MTPARNIIVQMRQVIAFAFTGWTLVVGLLWPQAASVYLQIITVKTPESLDQALAQLQSGQEFRHPAREHSTNSTAGDGGVWGPVRLNDLPEAVSARIEKAAEGELIHFFEPTLGHTILKKISPDAARKINFQLAFDRGAANL